MTYQANLHIPSPLLHPEAALAIATAEAMRRWGRYAGFRYMEKRVFRMPHPALLRLARQLEAAARAGF